MELSDPFALDSLHRMGRKSVEIEQTKVLKFKNKFQLITRRLPKLLWRDDPPQLNTMNATGILLI